MVRQCMLSTIDNPYDPFKEFKPWFNFDCEKGYNSCSRLARIAKLSDEMSDAEENIEIERAIDEIIVHDPLNVFIKVSQTLTEPEE